MLGRPFAKLQQTLNVSPDTIIDRYNALQEKGVIRGSTIVLNPKEIGYSAMAVFMIDISPVKEDENPFDSSYDFGDANKNEKYYCCFQNCWRP